MKRTMTTLNTFKTMTDEAKVKLTRSLLRTYEAHSAAEQVCVGFCYKKEWYYFTCKKLMPRWCRVERESTKKGGKVKVQLRLTNPDMEECLRKYDCIKLDKSFLRLNSNKGCAFERFITEILCGEKWKKDSIPFYIQGDVVMNGVQTQIKLNGAQVVMESTLCKRPWKKA